ncbi:MAG TPA: DUF1015 domain-containing protein [Actinomycetota bacterium]|nr:DUF1015 domain-containing protein [Actinomycetota bacterium]
MPRVFPFVGLVFDPAVTGPLDAVTAPPYDVIGDDARRGYLAASPYNVVRLDLAERDPGGDGYATTGALLRRWQTEGALVPSPEAFFAYEMRFRLHGAERRIRGVLCAMELEDWGGRVIPHERVMAGPVEDRLQLLRATRANVSAIYGTIQGPCRPLAGLLDSIADAPPLRASDDEEGVRHRLWALPSDTPVPALLGEETLLIADGHHRYTTALHYRDERRADEGAGPWDRMLTLIVDSGTEEPPVLPFHRIVVRGQPPTGGTRVRDLQEVLAEVDDELLRYGVATREGGVLVHRVAELPGSPPAVRALHEHVLDPDLRAGEDVRFTPDAVAADDAVRSGEASAAYFLPPTTTDAIRAVIDRGERLPQKSTYFWPKPRTGMLIRPVG